MIVKIKPEILLYERKIQSLCRLPYYNHSRGCPNFEKKEGCPPNKPLIDKVLDFDNDVFVIHTEYMVGEFAEKIRKKHPTWNLRQIYNPRYWQGPARKLHRQELERFLEEYPDLSVNNFPEAHGVNITQLMKDVGVELNWQWPPEHNLENKTYIVSLGGKLI